MGSRVSYTLVGLFVILLAIALVAAGLWFGGGLQSTEQFKHYSVYTTESVAGLSPGSRVTYKGVEVGQVQSISIDRHNPKRIHLVLAVVQSTPVSADTVATLELRGLTGSTFVELSGYTLNAPPPPKPPGEPYPVIRTEKSLLAHLDTAISEGIGSLNKISKQISQILSEQNREALTSILNNFSRVTDTLASNRNRIDQSLKNLQRITQSSAKATARLPQTLELLNHSLEQLDQLSQGLNQASASLVKLGQAGQSGMQRVLRTTIPELDSLLVDLRQATNHIDRLARELERQPSSLLRGSVPRRPGPGEGQ